MMTILEDAKRAIRMGGRDYDHIRLLLKVIEELEKRVKELEEEDDFWKLYGTGE